MVTEATLKRQHRHLTTVVEEGVILGFICQEDGFIMVPKEAKAARFNLNSKDHKPPDPLTGVPPWREVVSGSGSNTEGCSKLITHYLNPINRALKSYLEDTRHMLYKVKNINETLSPLHPHTRLIIMDVVAMYSSIPEGMESGPSKPCPRDP